MSRIRIAKHAVHRIDLGHHRGREDRMLAEQEFGVVIEALQQRGGPDVGLLRDDPFDLAGETGDRHRGGESVPGHVEEQHAKTTFGRP